MTATVVPLAPPVVADGVPRWLPWLLLGLLVLPFHPYWVDFEQVRRGLLAVLAGACIALRPRWFYERAAAWPSWLMLALGLPIFVNLIPFLHRESDLSAAEYVCALILAARLGVVLPRSTWLVPIATLLAATSLFGLLQRLGLAEFCGYGAVGEPVSVFGNLNVAAEFTTVAAVATLLLAKERPRLAAIALLLAGAYLAVNGSRSSLLALPIALAWLLVTVKTNRARNAAMATMLAVGVCLGAVCASIGPAPFAAVAPQAQPFVADRANATIEVRAEIAKSCWRMFLDAPVLGHGLGQFAVQYPRYRSQREIELSSLGRQFATSPQSAHDDWLQLLVEGGLPALLLWTFGVWQVLRASVRDRDPERAAPFVALLALMLVRAPLGNAPCAAIAFLLVAGGRAPMPRTDGARRRTPRFLWPVRLLCTLIAWLGLQPVLVQHSLAGYQAARAQQRESDLAALEGARNWFCPDARVEHLLAQEYSSRDRKLDAMHAIDAALTLRPNEPTYLLLKAELQVGAGRLDEAKATLKHAAELDPGDPQLLVQFAALYFTQRNHDAAVMVLYTDPHASLLATLAQRFDEFAALAATAKDSAADRRYRAEACLRRALDSTGDPADARAQALAGERYRLARDACAQAGLQKDPRFLALVALLALDTGQTAGADQAAAILRADALQPWQQAALGVDAHGEPRADRLRRLPSWAPLLPKAQ